MNSYQNTKVKASLIEELELIRQSKTECYRLREASPKNQELEALSIEFDRAERRVIESIGEELANKVNQAGVPLKELTIKLRERVNSMSKFAKLFEAILKYL